MTCLDYSPDGQYVATGGIDSKLKLWSLQSGFCFVTFTEHQGPVTSLQFAKRKQVLFSASVDGTVRAFDLIRYRNFKTFTSPVPEQFSCLAADPSAEIVCAGSQDSFEIYMWSVQTGNLLEIISGHSGPISSLQFSPTSGFLCSSSWDKTVMIRDVFSRDDSSETFTHSAEVLSVCFSPDGKKLASTDISGKISVWNTDSGDLVNEISVGRDITPGRKQEDLTKSGKNSGKYFSTISFITDGSSLLCGGNTPHVCIYDLSSQNLLKKFTITKNMSIDGIKPELNSKEMTEAGPVSLIDVDAENSDLEDRIDNSLPGVKNADPSQRKKKQEVRTSCVKFSPTGSSFSCSTTEGLFIYSLNSTLNFDPFDLELEITPASCLQALKSAQYLKSLCMSFRLGEMVITESVVNGIPPGDIPHVLQKLPEKYVEKLIKYLSFSEKLENDEVGKNRPGFRIQFLLVWCTNLFKFHANYMYSNHLLFNPSLVALSKKISKIYNDSSRV